MSALITGLIFFGSFFLLGPLFLAGVWAAFSRLTERRGSSG
jgi:hypothetical protein